MDQQQKKLISVIIPAKNRQEFIVQALNSVYSQKLPKGFRIEVILVDNNSNPPLSLFFHKLYKDLKIVRYSKQDSPAGARNKGLSIANGSYIAFLDSDDQWRPGFLFNSINILNNEKGSASVCLTKPFFEKNFPRFKKYKIIILNYIKNASLIMMYFYNNHKVEKSAFFLCQLSHMVFDSNYLSGVKFDEHLFIAEDWLLNVKASLLRPITIIPTRLVNFRYDTKSISSNRHFSRIKEKSYKYLIQKLPQEYKRGIFYKLFLVYINLFLLK